MARTVQERSDQERSSENEDKTRCPVSETIAEKYGQVYEKLDIGGSPGEKNSDSTWQAILTLADEMIEFYSEMPVKSFEEETALAGWEHTKKIANEKLNGVDNG